MNSVYYLISMLASLLLGALQLLMLPRVLLVSARRENPILKFVTAATGTVYHTVPDPRTFDFFASSLSISRSSSRLS